MAVQDHPDRYYGWTVARAAFSILAVTYGLQYTFGVLLPEIEASTGWSRTRLSGLYSLYLLVYSLLGAVTGRLSDRLGPRRVITVGGVCFALGWASLAVVEELWQVVVGFCVVAAIGMSASFVPCSATVIKWFSVRRGTALSLAISGAGLGGLVFPPLTTLAVAVVGWRATLLGMSVIALVWLLIAARWMVASPEAAGIPIEGELGRHARPDRGPVTRSEGTEPSLTLSAAVHTGAFWIISFLFMATWLVVFVPIVHLAPFVTSIGGTATGASVALSAIGLGGLIGRVLSGPAADRMGELPVLISMLLVEIGCYSVFASTTDLSVITIAAVAFGAAYGATVTLFSAVVGARFGRLHAGSIVGAIFIGAATSSAAGPLIAGILFDSTGGYTTTFAIGAMANVVALVLAVALLLVARPRDTAATP